MSDFIRIRRPMGPEFFHAGRLNTMKLVVAFRNIAKALKISRPN